MSMIFAGAIGNLIDGMFYGLLFDTGTIFESSIGRWVGYDGISKLGGGGYASFMNGCVVDMLYFPLFKFNWPTRFRELVVQNLNSSDRSSILQIVLLLLEPQLY